MSLFRRGMSAGTSTGATNTNKNASTSAKTSSSTPDTTRKIWLSPRFARIGFLMGMACLPVAAYSLYERISPLPSTLKVKFPLMARFYVRKAMWCRNLEEKAYYLDLAMQKVLSSGLGAASPQSTALVVYLSELYYDAPIPDPKQLSASYAALTHKPHIGEGVKEERARLEMSFKVAARLCDLLKDNDPLRANEYAERALMTMERSPSFLSANWKDHPLREKFHQVLSDKR